MHNFSSNLVVLFPIGCTLYIAMRMGDGQVDARNGLFRSILYLLIALLISLSLFSILFRAEWFSLLWLIGCGVLCIVFSLRGRSLNRTAMTRCILMANDDLARESLAQDYVRHNRGMVARRAKLLLRSLATGASLPFAMEAAQITTGTVDRMACRICDRYGKNPHFTRPLLNPWYIKAESERILGRLLPILWMSFGLGIVVFIFWMIVPTIQEIYVDFEMALPPILSLIARASVGIEELKWLSYVLGPILLLQATVLTMFACWVFPNLLQFAPMRWFIAPYYRSLGLAAMAIAARHEKDLLAICRSAAGIVPIRFMAERIEDVSELVRLGRSPEAALIAARMLTKPEASVVVTAINSGNLAWALERLAESSIERMLRRYSATTQLVVITAVLVFGCLYGLVAMAMIQSLADMILHTA